MFLPIITNQIQYLNISNLPMINTSLPIIALVISSPVVTNVFQGTMIIKLITIPSFQKLLNS